MMERSIRTEGMAKPTDQLIELWRYTITVMEMKTAMLELQ